MKMGLYELIRANNTASATFFAGRFEFLDLPGIVLSNCLEFPSAPIAQGGCGLPASLDSAPISTLQSWSLGAPAFYEQGFGDPRYIKSRPFTAAYWQDSWQIKPALTLNYGLRYELDSQVSPRIRTKEILLPAFRSRGTPLAIRRPLFVADTEFSIRQSIFKSLP
jgi:hypothetical protein